MTEAAGNVSDSIARRGLILILSSPSGAGKTTLTRAIAQDPSWALDLSISVTTRGRRPSEIDGRHYHFIDREAFDDLRGSPKFRRVVQEHARPRRRTKTMHLEGTVTFGSRPLDDALGDAFLHLFLTARLIDSIDRAHGVVTTPSTRRDPAAPQCMGT